VTASGLDAAGRPGRRAAALFLACCVAYSANGREISSGDTVPARLVAVSLVEDLRLDLDRFVHEPLPGVPLNWYSVVRVGDHHLSAYPIMPALLAAPVYALPIAWFGVRGPLVNALAKLAATLIAAGSVALVFLAARRLADDRTAWQASLVYALATSTWSVSSQGLWQHGPAQLFLALAAYLVLSARTGGHGLACVGGAVGLMIAARPPTVLAGLALVGYVFHLDRRAGARAAGLCVAALAPTVAYNLWYFGSLGGGYSHINATHQLRHAVEGTWSTPLAQGLAGLLLSPSRGLFVYSPVLLFVLPGLARAVREPLGAPGPWLALGWVASLVMMGKYSVWWGGHSFGPRLLADFLPLAALLMVPALRDMERSRAARAIFLGLFGVSVAFQIVGAFCHPSPRPVDWNATPQDVDLVHGRLWDWSDPQLVRLVKNGPRPPGFGGGE
jgi:hypothetical protein